MYVLMHVCVCIYLCMYRWVFSKKMLLFSNFAEHIILCVQVVYFVSSYYESPYMRCSLGSQHFLHNDTVIIMVPIVMKFEHNVDHIQIYIQSCADETFEQKCVPVLGEFCMCAPLSTCACTSFWGTYQDMMGAP